MEKFKSTKKQHSDYAEDKFQYDKSEAEMKKQEKELQSLKH